MIHPLADVNPFARSDRRTYRRKSLRIAPQLLIEMLTIPPEGLVIGDRRVFPDHDPIPPDAEVAAIRITDRGEIELDIESSEFPETHYGNQLVPLRTSHRVEFIESESTANA